VVGGLSGLIQLSLLALLTGAAWDGFLANLVAFLLAAQFNFWLSHRFTWGDRGSSASPQSILGRWARFHASIAWTALLNITVFAVARTAVADLPASALGITVAALANFLLGDRFVFREASAAAGVPGGESRRRALDPSDVGLDAVGAIHHREGSAGDGDGRLWWRRSGAGLGLTIAKRLVEAHRGTIGVENELRKGSLFAFALPKKEPAVVPHDLNALPDNRRGRRIP
jgi:putative flippase GtrA